MSSIMHAIHLNIKRNIHIAKIPNFLKVSFFLSAQYNKVTLYSLQNYRDHHLILRFCSVLCFFYISTIFQASGYGGHYIKADIHRDKRLIYSCPGAVVSKNPVERYYHKTCFNQMSPGRRSTRGLGLLP